MYQWHQCHLECWRFWTESSCAGNHKYHTLVTIIPHPQAIISNALDYILLIVDSSDPNLSRVALSSFYAWFHFVDLYTNILCMEDYQRWLSGVLGGAEGFTCDSVITTCRQRRGRTLMPAYKCNEEGSGAHTSLALVTEGKYIHLSDWGCLRWSLKGALRRWVMLRKADVCEVLLLTGSCRKWHLLNVCV